MFFIDIKSPKVQQNFEAERERERERERETWNSGASLLLILKELYLKI